MIVRGQEPERWTVVDNDTINNDSLSAEALGLLVYLLSKPADWQVRADHLQHRFGMGKNRTYRILADLRESGHAHYRRNGDGSTDWVIYADPRPQNRDEAIAPSQVIENKPRPQNPDQDFGDDIQSTERAQSTEPPPPAREALILDDGLIDDAREANPNLSDADIRSAWAVFKHTRAAASAPHDRELARRWARHCQTEYPGKTNAERTRNGRGPGRSDGRRETGYERQQRAAQRILDGG